jgi:hypothetical protein
VGEAQGTYRGDVYTIMGALSDILTDTQEILAILKGYDPEDDEEEESDA